ncbi:MAG: hypothetical protein WCI53_04990 [Bacteroidota bacterium]|jgi:hypothetical protein
MFNKIVSFKYLLYNKTFLLIAFSVFVLMHIIIFEIKRRYAIDVVKGVNFPFDDLYFYIKNKLGF